MTLILPVAGQSTRYASTRPKWLLTHPNGNLMLTESIRGLNPDKFNQILIIALKSHEEEFKFSSALLQEIQNNYSVTCEIILIDSSRNQPETVYLGIKSQSLKEGIFIKDCDNYFETDATELTKNYIAVYNLNNNSSIIAGNKSYVQLGSNGTVVNIIEKQVISNLFCCGGYYFKDACDFIQTFEMLKQYDNLYLSHIIYQQILDGQIFFTKEVKNYVDWGTLNDWKSFTSQYKVLFVDIDGVLVHNSAKHFDPKWGTTNSIQKNVETLNNLYNTKKCQIILTTARTEQFRDVTKKQLNKIGLKYDNLIMNLLHAKRYLINDFSGTNSYPTSIAINLKRNSDNLADYLTT